MRALTRAEIPEEWIARFRGQKKLGVDLFDRRVVTFLNQPGVKLNSDLEGFQQKTWNPSTPAINPDQKPSSNNRVATLREPLPKRNHFSTILFTDKLNEHVE